MRLLQRILNHTRNYVTTPKAEAKGLNAFITQPSKPLRSPDSDHHDGPLSMQSIAIKDNISTTSLTTTCGSSNLRSYTPPYNATVIDLLLKAGASVAGKTNLDEFGMGSHSTHSFFGAVQTLSGNSAGGSSGGSAVAVADGMATSALGTDTGGSVRLPAAWNGIVGFKPTYGRVSRWGVVAYANSLDTVGFLGRDVKSVKELFQVCDAYDEKDPTNWRPKTRSRVQQVVGKREKRRKLRIGVPREYNIKKLTPKWRELWGRTLKTLEQDGHSIRGVSLPHTKQALSAYYILAPAEASSNLAKYDGVRYGSPTAPDAASSTSSTLSASSSQSPASTHQVSPSLQNVGPGNALYTTTRGSTLGPEVQRRILLGAYTLSAEAKDNYFIRAQRIRRLVCRDFDNVFALQNPLQDSAAGQQDSTSDSVESKTDLKVDVLLTPTTSSPPPRLADLEAELEADPLKQYTADVFTVPASLAGLPSLNVPGPDAWGVQIIGQVGDDERVLNAGAIVQNMHWSK
ncbi:MAG: hypothetical protein Q9159_002154 [Coniocarpon cinnabarinum]